MADLQSGAERPAEHGAVSPSRDGRMSRQRKVAAILRLVRREDLVLHRVRWA